MDISDNITIGIEILSTIEKREHKNVATTKWQHHNKPIGGINLFYMCACLINLEGGSADLLFFVTLG